MSRSSKAINERAGFTLLEVLIALAVAAVFLGTLSRVLATGSWSESRRAIDQVSAVAVARVAATAVGADGRTVIRNGRIGLFDVTMTVAPLLTEPRPLALAPAFPAPDAGKRPQEPGGGGYLQRIGVVVRSPSGRRLTFETIRLEGTNPQD